jgi:hypothetical protein
MKTASLLLLAALALTPALAHGQACPLDHPCAPPHPTTPHPTAPSSGGGQRQEQSDDDDRPSRGPSRYELADRKTDTAYVYFNRYRSTSSQDDFVAARDAFIEANRIDPDYPQACIGMVQLLDTVQADGTAPLSNRATMINWAEGALKSRLKDLRDKNGVKLYLKVIIAKENMLIARDEIDALHTTAGTQGDLVDPRVDVNKANKDAKKKAEELEKKYNKALTEYKKK